MGVHISTTYKFPLATSASLSLECKEVLIKFNSILEVMILLAKKIIISSCSFSMNWVSLPKFQKIRFKIKDIIFNLTQILDTMLSFHCIIKALVKNTKDQIETVMFPYMTVALVMTVLATGWQKYQNMKMRR